MPEYRIVQGLTTGLRRDYQQNRNEQGLVSMTNLIPTEWGAKQIPSISYPLVSPSLSITWPHPQIMNGQYNRLLCDKTAIYEAVYGAAGSALSFVGSTAPTTSSNQWEMASFQKDIWFLTNVTNFVYRIPSNTSNYPAVITGFTFNSVANFQGKLVLGGIGGTVPSKLTGFFNEWKEMDHAEEITIGENTTLTKNWIIYSDFAGSARDVPFWDFMQMFDEYGGNTVSTDMKNDMIVVIRDAIESGRIGFFPLKMSGDIMRLLPIGDGLMAYTKSGVSYLRWTERGFVEDVKHDVGILYRGCAGGDLKGHLFHNANDQLNMVDANGNVERLGYREFGGTLLTNEEIICVDSEERTYTISDSATGYTLTRTGLSRTDAVRPTSMFRMTGASGLSGTAEVAADPVAAGLRTDTFDGGFRGVHEVVNVHIATTDTIGWTVAVAWRLNKNDAFTTTTAVSFDDRGNARVKVFGIEFQLILAAANRKLVDLERVEIEMRMGGKKKLRQLMP